MPRTIVLKGTAPSTAKKKAPAKKTVPSKPAESTKRPVGRPKGSTNKPKVSKAVQAAPEPANDTPLPHPRSKAGGMTPKEVQDTFGFGMGSDSWWACWFILKGGDSRIDVTNKLKEALPASTRNGRPKPASNIVGYVLRRMQTCGYKPKSTWTMVKG